MQDFVLKIYKKIRGRDPRISAAEGVSFVLSHPVATCQMLVPLRIFWAGYGLVGTLRTRIFRTPYLRPIGMI